MRFALKFLEGGLAGQAREVELSEKHPVTVGRDAGCTIALSGDDKSASPQHAKFVLEKGEVVVIDAGSQYGLLVNETFAIRARMKGGEQVRFGVKGPLAEVLLGSAASGVETAGPAGDDDDDETPWTQQAAKWARAQSKLLAASLAVVVIAALALALAGRGLAQRKGVADRSLDRAKDAYRQALARTGDFDSAAHEFDEVLRLLTAVPRGTQARAEADRLARTIREKRSADRAHRSAVEAAGAAAADEGERERTVAVAPAPAAGTASPSAAPPDKQACQALASRCASSHTTARRLASRRRTRSPSCPAARLASSPAPSQRPRRAG